MQEQMNGAVSEEDKQKISELDKEYTEKLKELRKKLESMDVVTEKGKELRRKIEKAIDEQLKLPNEHKKRLDEGYKKLKDSFEKLREKFNKDSDEIFV